MARVSWIAAQASFSCSMATFSVLFRWSSSAWVAEPRFTRFSIRRWSTSASQRLDCAGLERGDLGAQGGDLPAQGLLGILAAVVGPARPGDLRTDLRPRLGDVGPGLLQRRLGLRHGHLERLAVELHQELPGSTRSSWSTSTSVTRSSIRGLT